MNISANNTVEFSSEIVESQVQPTETPTAAIEPTFETVEIVRNEQGGIDYNHYQNKAHSIRSGFWWGLFGKC